MNGTYVRKDRKTKVSYVCIAYYSDGSARPIVKFCEDAEQAVCFSQEKTEGAMYVSTYGIDNPENTVKLICGNELREKKP